MTSLCQAYDNTTDAERAVADLLAAGVPGDDVRLLMGAEIHDARREARGRFSGSVAPEEQVGAFAGDGPERSAVRGSYAASGGAAEGSFGNAERVDQIASTFFKLLVRVDDGAAHNVAMAIQIFGR